MVPADLEDRLRAWHAGNGTDHRFQAHLARANLRIRAEFVRRPGLSDVADNPSALAPRRLRGPRRRWSRPGKRGRPPRRGHGLGGSPHTYPRLAPFGFDWHFGPFALRKRHRGLWLASDGELWDAQVLPIVAALKTGLAVGGAEVPFVAPLEMKAAAGADRKRCVLMSSIGVQRREQMPFPILNACGVLSAKSAAESASCIGCPSGKYQSTAGQTACKACDAGAYCPAGSAAALP